MDIHVEAFNFRERFHYPAWGYGKKSLSELFDKEIPVCTKVIRVCKHLIAHTCLL